MQLRATLRGVTYAFGDVKEVLAKANEEKSGDRLAGIAAASAAERVAAKLVLSELTLQELHDHPVVPYEEDVVTRLIDDVTTGDELKRLARGLSSEMIAACAKLMSNLDLVAGARKIRVVVHANNTLGLPGRLSTRLQPNHPSDDVQGILASIKEGLSYDAGDAVIGINPVMDSVERTRQILDATHDFLTEWRVPTQNCCLAHVTTQMRALQAGAKLHLMFQSIAGTEKACRSFGSA